jgi:cytochrome c
MKRVVCGFVMVAFFLVLGVAHIAQAVTSEEAKALGIKAAAFVRENGEEKGGVEINNPKGQFSRGPLYVTLHDFNAAIVQAKDPISGRYFNKDMIQIAKTEGCGWVEYNWTNKATMKVQKKKAWVQRVENMDLFTLCVIVQD